MSGAELSKKEIGCYERYSRILKKLVKASLGPIGKVHISSEKSLTTEPTRFKLSLGKLLEIAGMPSI